jgi:PEP-CTERM motif
MYRQLILVQKMKSLRQLFIALVACSAVTAGMAAPVIDQNQPNAPVYMAAFGQGNLAQSFQQTGSNISGAGIFLQQGQGTTGNITIALHASLNGPVLASGTAFGTQGSWVDVFWSPFATTANTTYFLEFLSDNNSLGIAGDVNNPYAFGNVFANFGFGSFGSFDYTFRTYSDDASNSVPEPAGLALVGLGLVAIAASRRKVAQAK